MPELTEPETAEARAAPSPAMTGGEALRRSGLAIAAGTIASRVTGFGRTAVIGFAIGYPIGDAYNTANTVPNVLYDLLLGGLLSAVVVPLLVSASRRDPDGGEEFAQRLLTMTIVVLGLISVLAVFFAPAIIAPYDGKLDPAQRHLAATFARFFLPQLVFYGAGAVIGAILNTRDRFTAPMWAPVLNNLIVIVTGIIFLTSATHPTPANLHGALLTTLAVGTTLGIVVQTIVLAPALIRSGVRLRPRFGLSGLGLRDDAGFAAWMLSYVVVNQLGYVVITHLANAAGAAKGSMKIGYSVYSYAYILFSLPYAIVAVTVVTAIFPAMTRSGAEGDLASVRGALDRGLALAGTILVPATAGLVAFGPLISTIVFAHGNISLDQARRSGAVLCAFAFGLVPFAAFQMQFRAWLATRDARSPALINVVATAINVVADLVLYVVLPADERVVGLAVGFSLSYLIALAISTRRLAWRIGIPRRRGLVLRTHVRLILATAAAVIPAYVIDRLLIPTVGYGPGGSLLVLVVAGAVGVIIFSLTARRLRIRELDALLSTLRSRI